MVTQPLMYSVLPHQRQNNLEIPGRLQAPYLAPLTCTSEFLSSLRAPTPLMVIHFP